jgi:hypothetical protein
MRRALLILLVTAAVSLAGYLVSYELATRPAKCMMEHPNAGMVWLKREYHLSDAQYARIAQMHGDYRPTCERMCRRIAEANAKVRALIDSNSTATPETEAALKEWALLQNECRVAMLRHVYAVSAEMPPEEGRRYIKMATGRIVSSGMEHATLVTK